MTLKVGQIDGFYPPPALRRVTEPVAACWSPRMPATGTPASGPELIVQQLDLRVTALTGHRHMRAVCHRMRKAVSRQPADRVRTMRAASAKCLAPRA